MDTQGVLSIGVHEQQDLQYQYYSVGVHEQHWKYISSVGVVPVHRQYQALATPPPPKGGLVHAGYIHVLLYTYTPIQRQYQALFL
ncbi:hypothetical protein J6590_104671 [Homalodisca vitripennis]|nr:hypothetical protein J6590_104671 [Homalodisca vitripennis]